MYRRGVIGVGFLLGALTLAIAAPRPVGAQSGAPELPTLSVSPSSVFISETFVFTPSRPFIVDLRNDTNTPITISDSNPIHSVGIDAQDPVVIVRPSSCVGVAVQPGGTCAVEMAVVATSTGEFNYTAPLIIPAVADGIGPVVLTASVQLRVMAVMVLPTIGNPTPPPPPVPEPFEFAMSRTWSSKVTLSWTWSPTTAPAAATISPASARATSATSTTPKKWVVVHNGKSRLVTPSRRGSRYTVTLGSLGVGTQNCFAVRMPGGTDKTGSRCATTKPSSLRAKSSAVGSVTLKWKGTASRYLVVTGGGRVVEPTFAATSSGLTATLTGLASGKSACFKVIAVGTSAVSAPTSKVCTRVK